MNKEEQITLQFHVIETKLANVQKAIDLAVFWRKEIVNDIADLKKLSNGR